ncbi:MAG: hypothetical protein H0T50_14695 [Gemmatimonadales bacterium]|nr:hypothetical protein [Gemmatimonadales bacterium]
MRFMTLYKSGRESDTPPSPEEMAKVGRLIEEMTRAGVLLSTDGLQPSSKGARVRISEGKLSVVDGPFAETKELISGYAIVEARSKEHAIELTKRFLEVMGEGESEVRLMHEAPAFDSASPPQTGEAKERRKAAPAGR